MTIYKREDTDKMLKAVALGKVCSMYLIVGDRYLCSEAADRLIATLLPDPRQARQCVTLVDGEQEDPARILASLKTYSLFAGRQIIRVSDSRLFHSKEVARKIWDRGWASFTRQEVSRARLYLVQLADIAQLGIEELADLSPAAWSEAFSFAKPQDIGWIQEIAAASCDKGAQPSQAKDSADLFMEAFESGLPESNILILLADTVDKRKKLYKFIAQHGVVVDLTVVSGSSRAARTDQDEVLKVLIEKTLAEFGKTIEPRAVAVLLERVGFYPVAIVRETEKLALYTGESTQITLQSLLEIVGRTREDALYEFTEAYTEQKLNQALVIAGRLCHDGTHPLILVAGLRNQLKKLLLVRAIRESAPPTYIPNMSYGVFQKGYLPELKVLKEEWVGQLPSHPYAAYMMFERAGRFSIKTLVSQLTELLNLEHRLKSSSISSQLLLERFLYGTI